MKKTIFVALSLLFALFLLVGCSNDKAALADWMQSLGEQQLTVYFWHNSSEKELTGEDVQKLVSITNDLAEDNFTENKHLEGITPEYGLRLVIGDNEYHINQADAHNGETEINFQGKQWWIKSSGLNDYMLLLLNTFEEQ